MTKLTLKQIQSSDNIAELLDDSELLDIGQQVVKGYEIDENSRIEWSENIKRAMDIAKQKIEAKNSPWPNASNLKFPIILKAALEYASRTWPEIIQNDQVVKSAIIGKDDDGSKYLKGQRAASYVSNQIINEIPDWDLNTDNCLYTLAITGIAFKKTYYDADKDVVCSEFCRPEYICLNHNVQSLDTAQRITHILILPQNSVREKQLRGDFLDVPLEELKSINTTVENYKQSYQDVDYNIILLEQYGYLDLDKDGYKEPYIITVQKNTKKVLRIVSAIDEVEKKDNKVICIKPEQYFTDFHFLNSPDGGFYSMGFGNLLLSLNTAVNTLWNQLVDAGTLANRPTFLASRGLRMKTGEFKLKMGEINFLDGVINGKISDSIYPLEFKEPSNVLLQLLEMMLKICDDLTSITDIQQGKQDATNVANATINSLIDHGPKVFAAVNKRVHRSLKSEYEKIYKLNKKYLSNSKYREVLNDPLADVKKDFDLSIMNVYPVADPTLSTINQRLTKASAVMALRTADPRAVDTYIAESLQLDQAQIKRILPAPVPNAPPPPDQQKIMAEISLIQAQIAKLSDDAQLQQQTNQLEIAKLQQEAQWKQAQAQNLTTMNWKMQKDAVHNDMKLAVTNNKMQSEQALKVAHLHLDAQRNMLDATNTAMSNQLEDKKIKVNAAVDQAKIAADVHKHDKDTRLDAAKTVAQIEANQSDANGEEAV